MRFYSLYSHGPHGRGGGRRGVQRDFLGSIKDTRTFLGHKKHRDLGFFLYLSFAQIKSSSYKHNLLLVSFFGYAQKVGIFWSIK